MSQQLHDRATRGEQLTDEERAHLDAWYAENDREEADAISLKTAAESIETLRSQLDVALTQLGEASQRVRELAAGNQVVRDQNEILRRQLAARATPTA